MSQNKIRPLAVTAVLGAVGFILMLLEFPVSFIIPPFIKLDFSELPCVICAFTFGPLWGILCCLIKNLIHLFITTSAGVGELSNFILGAVFTGVCGTVYKYRRTRSGALAASLIGALMMAVLSVATNYFIVYPAYVNIYGMPLEVILGMYRAIYKGADTLFKALVIFNLPFNFVKGIIDTALCFLIYKRLSPLLKFGLKSSKRS